MPEQKTEAWFPSLKAVAKFQTLTPSGNLRLHLQISAGAIRALV